MPEAPFLSLQRGTPNLRATAGVNPGGEAAQSHGSRGLGTGGSSIHSALPQALSSAEQARVSGDQASAKLMLRRNHA